MFVTCVTNLTRMRRVSIYARTTYRDLCSLGRAMVRQSWESIATCLSEKAALGTSFDGRSFTPPDIQLIRMGPVTLASIAEVRMP